jgi:hypothetical protein
MLPKFYQTHLKSELSLAEYLLLQILISMLQSIKKVSLEALANVLPIPITFESRRKRLQRFLSLPNLDIKKIWFPIVTTWLSKYFEPQGTFQEKKSQPWQRPTGRCPHHERF